MPEEKGIITIQTSGSQLLPTGTLSEMLALYQLKKDFIERVLKPGVDYGAVPGTEKPTLKKPGAEKMSNLFGLVPQFEDITIEEDWTGERHNGEPFFYYRQRCNLTKNGVLLGSAEGSCNSWEKKYRYRKQDRVCPNCGQPAILQSKNAPEFFCWAKKGGCGAKFPITDPRITEQEVGQIINPDVAEQVNTVLKMAEKRALVAAVLITTGVSDYFTQDMEDFVTGTWADADDGAGSKGTTAAGTATTGNKAPEAQTNLMTIEEAFKFKTSKGQPYSDLPKTTFGPMLEEIKKKLAGKLERSVRNEYERKQMACEVILEYYRQEEASAAEALKAQQEAEASQESKGEEAK